MCCTSGEDCGLASTIFNEIDSKMTENAVSWSNCVGFSVDNTSVNMGAHNSILSRVLKTIHHVTSWVARVTLFTTLLIKGLKHLPL